MKKLIAILFLLTCNLAQAEMYKSLDENGEVVYSDKPPTLDAKEFNPPSLTVQQPVKYKPKPKAVVEPKALPYTELKFSKPTADANFFNEDDTIEYELIILPALNTKLGHYLNIQLDGTVVSAATTSLSGVLKNVDRGSHNLTADLCDTKGTILRSASIQFQLHKASLLQHPPVESSPPPPPPSP